MVYGGHRCAVCIFTSIPKYRVFCKYCFVAVPWQLRIEVMNAHRVREVQPDRYDRAMGALRAWKGGG